MKDTFLHLLNNVFLALPESATKYEWENNTFEIYNQTNI